MAGPIALSKISETIAPNLISTRNWGDASFISLPMVYPSGSFVTVRLTYAPGGIRVSDSGFAYREAESFGATRSFANSARAVVEKYGVEIGRRAIFVDVPVDEVERAIFDVSAASKALAERIVANISQDGEAAISELLHARLDHLFPTAVEHEGKIVGASTTEWDVTAVTKVNGHSTVFQAVPNWPVSVFKASTAFHDLAALENPPTLVSVVSKKAEMGKNYSILAQAGKVIEVGQADDVFRKVAA